MAIKSIKDLRPDERNANRGTERGVYMIETSLSRYGAGRSILADKHGRIIAGNKTLQGAASIGMEDVILVPADGTKLVVVQRTDLDLETDAAAKELAVADNRASEVGLDWDPEALAEIAAEADLSPLFFDDELDRLIAVAEPEEVLPPEDTDAYHLENPYADRAEKRQEAVASGEAEPTRFVQLILPEAEYEAFMAALKDLAKRYGSSTITQTIYRTVLDAANQA